MQVIGLHGPARAGKDTIADYLVSQYGFLKFAFSDALYREVAAAYGLPDESLLRDAATKEATTERLSLDRCNDREFVERARNAVVEAHQGLVFPMAVGLSPRWILQQWGTEYRRAQNPDYWIEQADLWMEAFVNTLKHTVTQQDRDDWTAQEFGLMSDSSPEAADAAGVVVGSTWVEDHPGVAVSGVRFVNEYAWLKRYNGVIWHIDRDGYRIPLSTHASEKPFPLRTGDKLIQNFSNIERLYTGVVLALQGNDIVNTSEE